MNKTIKATLSSSSIHRCIEELQRYRDSLQGKCDEICRKLGTIGINTAVSLVPVDTGELASGIAFEKQGPNDYLIVSTGDYVAFVEFGTGVVGAGAGYAGELPSIWQYDVNGHGWEGWTYYDDDRDEWRWTPGRAGAGYMAGAADAMRQSIAAIVREVMGQ